MKTQLSQYFNLLRLTIKEFSSDNVLKLSASLAYNTIFSIGPFLLVIISLTGIFVEKKLITDKMYSQLQTLIGTSGAKQILEILQNIQRNDASGYGILGIVMLMIGATSIFADIQDSINYIWSIKAKPKKGWLKYLRNRLLSFSLIVGLGFLFVVSLMMNTVSDILTERMQRLFANNAVFIFKAINLSLLFLIITLLFVVIYKVLPDAHIRWKDALTGAIFTSILFILGKFLIGYYIGNSRLGNTYGVAASVIIILLWIYYTAIILYVGAEFTKLYAIKIGKGIEPDDTAVFIVKTEVKELPKEKKVHL